jgi:hypothetical protein
VLTTLWILISAILVMVGCYKGAYELATRKVTKFDQENWIAEGWRSIIHWFDTITTVLLIPFGVGLLLATMFGAHREQISMISFSIMLIPSLIGVGAVLAKWLNFQKHSESY